MRGLDDEYWVPEHVREWLKSLGFALPLGDIGPHIRVWNRWMRALGDFYDYRDTDGIGRVYEVHRRSIHPAMRACREWGGVDPLERPEAGGVLGAGLHGLTRGVDGSDRVSFLGAGVRGEGVRPEHGPWGAPGIVAHACREMRERVRRPPWTTDRLRADDPRTGSSPAARAESARHWTGTTRG